MFSNSPWIPYVYKYLNLSNIISEDVSPDQFGMHISVWIFKKNTMYTDEL